MPTVQLLHTTPDGDSHVDWMLATDPRGERPLRTFRLPGPLATLAAGETMDAVRLPDHRPRYLSYEGPISGDRGIVRRIAEGTCMVEGETPRSLTVFARWRCEDAPMRLHLRNVGEDVWEIQRADADDCAASSSSDATCDSFVSR